MESDVQQKPVGRWPSDRAWRLANPNYDTERATKQWAAGLCRYCRRKKLSAAGVCEQHWFSNVAFKRLGNTKLWAALKEKLERQDFLCVYTRQKLTICVNASLDHIQPVSRFPQLSGDIGNVEWVRTDVNYAKRNKTKDEFLALCKTIAVTAKEI